jgi:hypothetical protein
MARSFPEWNLARARPAGTSVREVAVRQAVES